MAPTYAGFGQGTNLSSGGLQLVDAVLSNVAKQYRPQGFLYDSIVAAQLVEWNIGRYPIFDPAYFFSAAGNIAVADDAETPIIDFQYSTDTYQCIDYRLQTRITRKEMLQANPLLRMDYSKTIGLLTSFALNREVRLAKKLDSIANGGKLTAAGTPSVKWDTGTSATPATIQGDIQAAILTAYKTGGKRPNTIVLDFPVALAIANDFTIKDLIKYQIGPDIIKDALATVLPSQLFGLKVLIADGTMQNTARPGQAASLSGVWGNAARLLYTDPSAQWGQPATVYAFRGRVTEGATQAPQVIMPTSSGGQEPGPAGEWAIVDRWFDMDPPAEHIRAWECVDEKVVAPETGIIIPNVLQTY